MPDVKLKTRIQNKYKTLNEWNEIAAGEFVPLKGEVCYAIDGNILYQKVGDGVTDFTELEWLLSPSVQSDQAENNEQSFAFIKNRLGYNYHVPVSEEEQWSLNIKGLQTLEYSKEMIDQLLPDIASLLPSHINNYLIEQFDIGDDLGTYISIDQLLFLKNPMIELQGQINNIFTTDILKGFEASIGNDNSKNFMVFLGGNPALATIWLLNALETCNPMPSLDYDLDKDYCLILAISKSSGQVYGAFIGDIEQYLTDTHSVIIKHTGNIETSPISKEFLVYARSDQEEMDSSKASYIYNKYGDIVTADIETSGDYFPDYKTVSIIEGAFTINTSSFKNGDELESNNVQLTNNWTLNHKNSPFRTVKVQFSCNLLQYSATYEHCPIFFGQDYFAMEDDIKQLVFIGNPVFLSNLYSTYVNDYDNLIVADQLDNEIPFLFGFDPAASTPMIRCYLKEEFSSQYHHYEIKVYPQDIALVTRHVPQGLLPIEKSPWIYNEEKESILAPTAYEASGVGSVAIGSGTSATKQQAFATGSSTNANGVASFTQGGYTKASKIRSAALGYKTWSNGANALTIGDNTYATGSSAFAGGQESTAAGIGSVAFAQGSYVSGKNSVAFGYGLLDDVSDSIEGAVRPSATTIEIPAADYDYDWCSLWSYCFVSGATTDTIDVAIIKKIAQSGDIITLTLDREIDVAHTDFEFYQATRVEGDNSFSMGSGNLVEGDSTIALGDGLTSTYGYQTVIGQYNIDDDKAFIIGQGSEDEDRKNIFSVDREGNTRATSLILTSPNGTEFKISVDNAGNIITEDKDGNTVNAFSIQPNSNGNNSLVIGGI